MTQTKQVKLNKNDLGYILHLLQEDYRLAGSKGKTKEQFKRICNLCKKVAELWMDEEEVSENDKI